VTPSTGPPYDAVVIGGGPAGLSAASWLARYRRAVLVVDSGQYRAGRVEQSHGYLGRDPQRPTELLERARERLLGYATADYQPGEVVQAARDPDGLFRLTCADRSVLRSHRVVVATGVRDAFPDIDGFDVHYGASAFHCPSCDGYEARDADVVAFGWDRRLIGFATGLLDWARSVTVVTGGRCLDGQRDDIAMLDRYGVEVVTTPPRRLLGERGALEAVELEDDRRVPASLLFFSVAHTPRNALARQLGADVDEEGCVRVEPTGATCVHGVYAAGDLTPGLQLVQAAAAQGAAAGIECALSLHGQPGSQLSPDPAPDAPADPAPD
jgi:thioredoxin reductase